MPAETSGARMDEAMRTLADPTRREILARLAEGEATVSAGLVTIRPSGNLRLYRWRPEGLSDVTAFVREMWSGRLEALKAAAEREEWPARERAKRRTTRETTP